MPPRVLIVDASPDTREVLRSLVERSGAVAVQARGMQQAVELAEASPHELIVLDADSDRTPDRSPSRSLEEVAARTGAPIVVLGTPKRGRGVSDDDRFVAKPYHYGPLARKIMGLLAANRAA